MQAQPYIFFDGCCEEALGTYRDAVGAEVTAMMRFRDSPDGPPAPADRADKILHASFRVGDTVVMASDGHCAGQPRFEGFSLALTVPDEAAADRVFAALADGGQVRMPLAKTFFSPRFGMLADRFGVGWMVMVG